MRAADTFRRPAFFGRRRGKTVRPAQAAALEAGLEALRLDLSTAPPHDLRHLFPMPVRAVRLEIGFGAGEHLLSEARRQPDIGFIGVEPFVNGMAKFMAAFAQAPLANLRVHDDDAVPLLDWLPAGSLVGIDLLYPDPWPKRRHWKRRFVSPKNLDRFARLIEPGGQFRFASDVESYVNWTLLACRAHRAFEWTAAERRDWAEPYPFWPGTRYEAKALREGRTPAYLSFRHP